MYGDVIFGPVASRRLGISLGVDIIPTNVCSFDCVYCELGGTAKKTAERKEYIPIHVVDSALEDYFRAGKRETAEPVNGEGGGGPHHLDHVTFSGSGEPTLHTGIGHFIQKVKDLTDTPVAVITNSSLLPDPQVRRELMGADVIIPSLDAALQRTFARINRPVHGIEVGAVIEGIRLLAAEFKGKVWLEIVFVEGVNDNPTDVEALAQAAAEIKPDVTQIGTIVRPPSEKDAYPIGAEGLMEIATHFKGRVEIIPAFRSVGDRESGRRRAEKVAAMLKIRPETLEGLCGSLGMHRREVLKYIKALRGRYDIREIEYEGKRYYKI